MYHEKDLTPTVESLDELLNKDAWLMFPASQEDEQCIGDFVRAFHRPPLHVVWSPTTPMWKYAGPVYTEEELARRWEGWQGEKIK